MTSPFKVGAAGVCDCEACREECVCQGAGRIGDSPCQHCEAGAAGFARRDEKDAAEQLVKGVA
jgi:hypothetical protein